MQVGIWSCLFALVYLYDRHFYSSWEALLYTTIDFVVILGLVLVHYHFIFEAFIKKAYVKYIILLLGSIGLTLTLVYYVIASYVFGPYEHQVADIVLFAGILLVILPTSGMYRFVINWYRAKTKEEALKREKLEQEMQFLKTQISPHFFFNTLNNIYSLIQKKDDKAGELVTQLSDLMRYVIYDSSKPKISLEKEVEFLEQYVKLEEVRMSDASHRIDFYTSGKFSNHEIAPLILINFIDNCFKHNDLNTNDKGFIHISISLDNNQLIFTSENTFSRIPNKTSKGVGLKNAERQLQINYAEKYSLEFSDEDSTFKTKLTLVL